MMTKITDYILPTSLGLAECVDELSGTTVMFDLSLSIGTSITKLTLLISVFEDGVESRGSEGIFNVEMG